MYEYSSIPAARQVMQRARAERSMMFRTVFSMIFGWRPAHRNGGARVQTAG